MKKPYPTRREGLGRAPGLADSADYTGLFAEAARRSRLAGPTKAAPRPATGLSPATARRFKGLLDALDAPPTDTTPIGATAELGQMVRERRKAMGLSQQDFADRAGLGRRFVSELENGKKTLEIDKVLTALATAGIRLFSA